VDRLEALTDGLLCHKRQLETYLEQGVRTLDAKLSIAQFEASLKQVSMCSLSLWHLVENVMKMFVS